MLRSGHGRAASDLNDADASEWEEPYRQPRKLPIHAMALLAADDRELLDQATGRVERSLLQDVSLQIFEYRPVRRISGIDRLFTVQINFQIDRNLNRIGNHWFIPP